MSLRLDHGYTCKLQHSLHIILKHGRIEGKEEFSRSWYSYCQGNGCEVTFAEQSKRIDFANIEAAYGCK